MKPVNTISAIAKTGLISSLIALSGSSSVSAIPSYRESYDVLSKPIKESILSQIRNDAPPEVIIDTDSDSSTTRDGSSSTNRTRTRTSTTSTNRRNSDTRFTCDYVDGEYTVMYYPESQGSGSAYPWAIPSALGGGWTPERRCNEITARLESYRADGLLEMSTGVENGYDTVCVTTQVDPTDCRIVLTVPPGQDPQVTRDLVFENLLVADDGQATQGVYTYGEEGSTDIIDDIGNVLGVSKSASPESIDLRPFLSPADGGTGTQLNKSRSPQLDNGNQERKPAIFE